MRLGEQIDEFEGYVHPHAVRIAALADEIAKALDVSAAERLTLRRAALIHDIGEAAMNRDYIKRGGLLSEDERLDLMRHPVIGEQAVAKQDLPRAIQLIVRWHQEWWNGDGYPDNLRREQIPLLARILRVADTYAALTDNRPYSPAIGASDARAYLVQWAGLEFDPRIVRVFLNLPAELPELASFGENGNAAPALIRRVYDYSND